jgi:hypothetical protein
LGGEQTEEHCEFAEGKAAISFIPRTTDKIAVIAIRERKLANMGGRPRFERLLNSMLKVMKRFAVAAKMGGTEAYIWVQETANDKVIKLGDSGLRSSNNEAWPWMRDRIYAADAEDLKEEMEFGFDGMDTSAWDHTETQSSHGSGHGGSNSGGVGFSDTRIGDDGPYCQHCKRGGHSEYSTNQDERQPTVCTYCGKYGHLEAGCLEVAIGP